MQKLLFIILCCLAPSLSALEIALKPCATLDGEITDIEFFDETSGFVTEKGGRLFYFSGCDKKARELQRFKVIERSELGLLGVAVAPDKKNIYLYYSPKDRSKPTRTRLSSFDLDISGTPVLSNEKILLEVEQPYNNHDGGALKFGPDGNLYLGVGDGGSAGDPLNAGQDVGILLGSIVRIRTDPASAKGYSIPEGNLQDFKKGALPEILAQGLRNPWKFAFDSKGNLIIADVGQNLLEEISIIPKASLGTRELNLGWRLKEASACYQPKIRCDQPGLLDPVFEYGRDFGSSITGGETILLNDQEYYLFADFASGSIAALHLDRPETIAIQKRNLPHRWTTFGKTASGDVYIADIEGNLFRIYLK